MSESRPRSLLDLPDDDSAVIVLPVRRPGPAPEPLRFPTPRPALPLAA